MTSRIRGRTAPTSGPGRTCPGPAAHATNRGSQTGVERRHITDAFVFELVRDFVADAYAHCKFIGHTGDASLLFEAAGLGGLTDDGFVSLDEHSAADFISRCAKLRFWPRQASIAQRVGARRHPQARADGCHGPARAAASRPARAGMQGTCKMVRPSARLEESW